MIETFGHSKCKRNSLDSLAVLNETFSVIFKHCGLTQHIFINNVNNSVWLLIMEWTSTQN